MKRVHVFISGRVQGVFFRSYVRKKAKELGVNGFVRNLADGRVEGVFDGKEENLEKMLEFCRNGPMGAKVDKVDVEEEAYKEEFLDFEVRY